MGTGLEVDGVLCRYVLLVFYRRGERLYLHNWYQAWQ
jgi:hypothetical protein